MKIGLKCLLKFETENSPLAEPPESQALFSAKIEKDIKKIGLFYSIFGIVIIKLETKQINMSDIYSEFITLIFQISMVTTLLYVIYVTSMKIHHWFLKPSSSILILLIFQISMVTTLMYVTFVTSMKIHLWFPKPSSSILILLIFQISMVTTLMYVIYVTSMKIHLWFPKP